MAVEKVKEYFRKYGMENRVQELVTQKLIILTIKHSLVQRRKC